MGADMAETIPDWRIEGDWWDLCSCAIGCPCIFSSNPTQGFCDGALSWLIREGNYGDVPLGGLAFVAIVHFKGNVFEKNREFGWLIDDRADEAQRAALARIVTGEAGGAFAAWADLRIKLHGVEYVPLKLEQTPEAWTVESPGRVSGFGRPFRKFLVPAGGVCTIVNAPRPEVTPGNVTLGEAVKNEVTAFGKRWSWPGHSAKHIPFEMRGPGAFTWKQSAA
jgi:hypothetical protein